MNKHVTGEETQMANKHKNMLKLSRHQIISRYDDRDFFFFFLVTLTKTIFKDW